MQDEIYACLWFNGKAKEAAAYYCSIFKKSRIVSESPAVVIFELNGKKFMALNGGSDFKFTEAVSFVVDCKDQEEIDYYWNALTQGGQESMCGWLKDKYGLSWQIVPTILGDLMNDPVKGQGVVQAFLKMKKFDIETLLNV